MDKKKKKILKICIIFSLILVIFIISSNFINYSSAAINSNYAGGQSSTADMSRNKKSDVLNILAEIVFALAKFVEFLVSNLMKMVIGVKIFPWADKVIFNSIKFLDINFINPSNGSLFYDVSNNITTLGKVVRNLYYTIFIISVSFFGVIVGILALRLAISTIAAEKAKYKEAIKNVVASVILIFTCHYLISFIFFVNEKLVEYASILAIEKIEAVDFYSLTGALRDYDKNDIKNYLNKIYGIYFTVFNSTGIPHTKHEYTSHSGYPMYTYISQFVVETPELNGKMIYFNPSMCKKEDNNAGNSVTVYEESKYCMYAGNGNFNDIKIGDISGNSKIKGKDYDKIYKKNDELENTKWDVHRYKEQPRKDTIYYKFDSTYTFQSGTVNGRIIDVIKPKENIGFSNFLSEKFEKYLAYVITDEKIIKSIGSYPFTDNKKELSDDEIFDIKYDWNRANFVCIYEAIVLTLADREVANLFGISRDVTRDDDAAIAELIKQIRNDIFYYDRALFINNHDYTQYDADYDYFYENVNKDELSNREADIYRSMCLDGEIESEEEKEYAKKNFIGNMGKFFRESAWGYEVTDEGKIKNYVGGKSEIQPIGAVLYAIFVFQSLAYFTAYTKRVFYIIALVLFSPIIIVYDFLMKSVK